MKVLNFSVVEILPSLLDKSKVQTIRPAFINCETCYSKGIIDIGGEGELCYDCNGDSSWKETPPRFKVGEKVNILWKQRSKDNIFCSYCGKGLEVFYNYCECMVDEYGESIKKHLSFNKTLGTVEITEVFKIEIGIENYRSIKPNYENKFFVSYKQKYNPNFNSDLAKRDGFISSKQMFKTLDKMYDLSNPKEFWVYKWRWLK